MGIVDRRLKRLQSKTAIQEEVSSLVKSKIAQGKDAPTIRKEVKTEMQNKYGMDVNWTEVLKIVLQVLSMLLMVFADEGPKKK